MRAPNWAIAIVSLGTVLIQPVFGQAVISTRSGLVHYFEGTVSVAGRPLESHLGKYVSIPEGADLRAEHGRAEVLLTPGVFLRVGESTTIRMIQTALSDTQVELVAGSAVLDSTGAGAGRLCTLIYKGWKLTQAQKGVYRLDSDPPRLLVREGEVEVSAAGDSSPVSVAQGMELPLAPVLAPEKADGESRDALNDWSDGREQSIAADNTIAANIQDPATMSASGMTPDSFTYFPMLGIPSYSSVVGAMGLYGTSSPYQPGFYSIYLPGYVRPPSYLGLGGTGLRGLGLSGIGLGGLGLQHSPLSPSRIFSPISPLPRSPGGRPTPIAPTPVRGGARVGGHR
jgi:hypothetical protein